MNLNEGDPAPDFTLPGDGGETIQLSNFRGQNVVLYFYPKDDTPGCTKEAIGFTEMGDDFAAAQTVIIGMSPDTAQKHDKFKAKYDLTVKLAADEEKTTLEAYGVWVEKKMYGRQYMGVERTTFLIDGSGTISKIWRKVKVPGHVEAVLEAARQL